jgi:hypothetical protein
MKRLIVTLLLLLLSACGSEAWAPAPQSWEDITVSIETRPSPVRSGMNEFLVIANRQQKGFMSDLLVHIRTDGSGWRQAIPDGALGVFRRALPVDDPATDHLHVRLMRKGKETELLFSLAPEANAAH